MLDRVATARADAFIGRTEELLTFTRRLRTGGGVVYVHGPGGIGKTALLRRFARLADDAGRTVVWADARDAGQRTPAPAILTGGRKDTVLLVDTAELLGPPDRWLTEDAVAGLTEDTLVVLASREPVPLSWRVDPGWRHVLCPLPLRAFSASESASFLADQDVPAAEHAAAIAFTRGHPLALALVADARAHHGAALPDPAPPDVVTSLLDTLLRAVPGPEHRAALEACALVRVTTEPVLAALLDDPEAGALFDWLRRLSIMELGPDGLAPHDLVRDALVTELRWRHPARHEELRGRATAYYRHEFSRVDPATRRRVLADGLFLYRDHPIVGGVISAPGSALTLAPLSPGEREPAVAMVNRHEGPASAGLARRWLRRQPQNSFVVRDETGGPVGYVQLVALADVDTGDRRADPVVAAAWRYAAEPLREGYQATLVRFWLGRDTYQDFGPVQTVMTLHNIEHSLLTPDLALTLTACARPDDWTAITAHTRAVRVPMLDFTVDGRTAGVFVHDWRALPPLDWLAVVAGVAAPPPTVDVRPLSSAEFSDAVKAALRDLNRVDRLGTSPLLGCRLVATRCPDASRVERAKVLQQVIRGAAGQLAESPRDVGAFRAIHHTYLQPAPTQREACDLLNLPTTTYRRHLAAGVGHLTAILWQQECDAASPGSGG